MYAIRSYYGVHHRELPDRLDRRGDHEGQVGEGDPLLLLRRAQGGHPVHVHLREGVDMGRGPLAHHHVVGDHLPDRGEGDHLVPFRGDRGPGRGRGRLRLRGTRRRFSRWRCRDLLV